MLAAIVALLATLFLTVGPVNTWRIWNIPVMVPPFADTETTFAELAARVEKTTAFLRSIERSRFEGSDTRPVEIKFRSLSGTYAGEQYLMGILLPDFFFHVTTAHDILRHRGLAVGKVDYLGQVAS